MPATTSTAAYAATRERRHPDCWVCAPTNGHGLAVSFQADETGRSIHQYQSRQDH